jgi:hypothetical protein
MLYQSDELNWNSGGLNNCKRDLNRREGKLSSPFYHPNQIYLFTDSSGILEPGDRYADGNSLEYNRPYYKGFFKFKRDET